MSCMHAKIFKIQTPRLICGDLYKDRLNILVEFQIKINLLGRLDLASGKK